MPVPIPPTRVRKLLNISIVAGMLLSTLCFPAAGQVTEDSVLVDGIYRSFCFKKPDALQNGASLVFAVHGSGGRARDFSMYTSKIDPLMQKDNFMLVYPQGYQRYWNECRKASTAEANRIDINEEGFFLAMIDYFEKNHGINRQKVFVSGVSGGGQMAYKMGMRLPNTFRAIAAVVANLPTEENMDCTPVGKPIATLIINGTADAVNPYEGGQMKAGLPLGTVQSTDASFRYWAELSGYRGNPVRKPVSDLVPGNDISMEGYTFKKRKKPEVTLIKVINGGHGQPADLDFYTEVWSFFKRQL